MRFGAKATLQRLRQIRSDLGWRYAPDRMIDRSQPRPDPALDEVYLNRGLILIHIPKNAGTSVEDALFGYRVRHRTWFEVRSACPRAWASVPKIAILRDPVDRFLSAYDYLRGGGRNQMDRKFGAHLIGDQSAASFVHRLSVEDDFRKTVMRFFHFRPQTDYVCDGETVMVDTLIPFHDMADGLTKAANLPPGALNHANKTSGSRTGVSDLSQTQVDLIRNLYARDVALFDRVCAAWSNNLTNSLQHRCGTD